MSPVATPTEASTATPAAPAFSPLYQQIKALLVQSLQDGVWQPGQVIPSENELALRYRVSQGTVRKAIDELAARSATPCCSALPAARCSARTSR